MATSQTIGNPHIILTANAEQAIAEIRKADAAYKQSSRSISGQVGSLVNAINRKFSGASFARSILSGIGIGSGFMVAQKAAQQISGYWERAAEAAQAIEASSQRQLAATMRTIAAHQTDAQHIAAMQKDYARLQNQLQALPAQGSNLGNLPVIGSLFAGYTPEELAKRRAEIVTEMQELGAQIDEAGRALEDKTKALDEKVRQSGKAVQAAVAGYEISAGSMGLQIARRVQGDTISLLESQLERAILDAGQMRRLRGNPNFDDKEISTRLIDDNKQIVDILKKLEPMWVKQADLARQVGDSFSSAFERAVIGGEGFDDVLRSLRDDLIKMFLQLALLNPIKNAIFGSMKGWTMLDTLGSVFGFAGGGRPPVGRASVVGENGPELFVPDSAGTVVPNGALGGDTYNFAYRFDSGVTPAQLMPLLAQNRRQTISDIQRIKRGGGQLAASI